MLYVVYVVRACSFFAVRWYCLSHLFGCAAIKNSSPPFLSTMRRVCWFLLLGGGVSTVSGTEGEYFRRLVDVSRKQQTQLLATVVGLRAEFFELQQKHDALVVSTTAQRHKEARWQREIAEK